jgi:diguanylate cyclase (GGDEF)-like protein
LPNRRAWNEELQRRLSIAREMGHPFCVALLDLDHFKQVNDGWGHPAGDQLLAATAAALKQSLRQDDFVARLGGDEFGLLLTGVDAPSAAGVVERIRASLPARIAQTTRFVTSASAGYCVWNGEREATPESLLAQADRARRVAKTQGRDRVAGEDV